MRPVSPSKLAKPESAITSAFKVHSLTLATLRRRSLSAADLASLSTQVRCSGRSAVGKHRLNAFGSRPLTLSTNVAQNRYMRQLATAAELWQPLCEVRWPRCATKSAYGGNWQRMYQCASSLCRAFITSTTSS